MSPPAALALAAAPVGATAAAICFAGLFTCRATAFGPKMAPFAAAATAVLLWTCLCDLLGPEPGVPSWLLLGLT